MKCGARYTVPCMVAAVWLLPAVFASGASPVPRTIATNAGGPATNPADQTIRSMLEETRESYDIPGIAVAIFNSESIPVEIASGRRRMGDDAQVTLKDKFHVGSNTKAMTATLIALFIEDHRLSWSLKLAELFPELAGSIDPSYNQVTLENLLRHRAKKKRGRPSPGPRQTCSVEFWSSTLSSGRLLDTCGWFGHRKVKSSSPLRQLQIQRCALMVHRFANEI